MSTMLISMIRHDLMPFAARDGGFAREWAAYKQALRRVEAAAPEHFGGPGLNALTELDEEAVALVNAAWEAGAVIGHAFADAEAALNAAPMRVCPACHGDGLAGGEAGGKCIICGGRGTVERDGYDWD